MGGGKGGGTSFFILGRFVFLSFFFESWNNPRDRILLESEEFEIGAMVDGLPGKRVSGPVPGPKQFHSISVR